LRILSDLWLPQRFKHAMLWLCLEEGLGQRNLILNPPEFLHDILLHGARIFFARRF
jgi:hypothetical protein